MAIIGVWLFLYKGVWLTCVQVVRDVQYIVDTASSLSPKHFTVTMAGILILYTAQTGLVYNSIQFCSFQEYKDMYKKFTNRVYKTVNK